mgnify:CR=1 FL=1
MRFFKALLVSSFVFTMWCAGSGANAATIVAKVDLSDQKMRVYINGIPRHSWPVSTARRGYRTPVGTFRPGFHGTVGIFFKTMQC